METLTMSLKERERLVVFGRVKRQELNLVQAAELLGLSYRQTKRSFARYRADGDAGLAHRLRGKSSNRGVDDSRRDVVVARVRSSVSGPLGEGAAAGRDQRSGRGQSVLGRDVLAGPQRTFHTPAAVASGLSSRVAARCVAGGGAG